MEVSERKINELQTELFINDSFTKHLQAKISDLQMAIETFEPSCAMPSTQMYRLLCLF